MGCLTTATHGHRRSVSSHGSTFGTLGCNESVAPDGIIISGNRRQTQIERSDRAVHWPRGFVRPKRQTYTRSIGNSPTATIRERESRTKDSGAMVGRSIHQRLAPVCAAKLPSRSEPIHPDGQDRSNGKSKSRATSSASVRQRSKYDLTGPKIVNDSIRRT